jgi:hypothetical protein
MKDQKWLCLFRGHNWETGYRYYPWSVRITLDGCKEYHGPFGIMFEKCTCCNREKFICWVRGEHIKDDGTTTRVVEYSNPEWEK